MDLDKNQISVRYTYQRVDKQWILKNTKTDGSSRMVILPAVVSNILKKQKQKQKEWQLFHGPDYQLSGFINTWPDGRPIVTEYVGKQFKKFVEENGLPVIRFHDLRHSHATELLKAGVNPKIVSERLGHSSIRITLDTYSHVVPTLQKDAAEIAANGIFGKKKQKKTRKKS